MNKCNKRGTAITHEYVTISFQKHSHVFKGGDRVCASLCLFGQNTLTSVTTSVFLFPLTTCLCLHVPIWSEHFDLCYHVSVPVSTNNVYKFSDGVTFCVKAIWTHEFSKLLQERQPLSTNFQHSSVCLM
jgi:hypothetical protein